MFLMLVSTIAHAQITAFERMLDDLLDGTVPAIEAKTLEKRLSGPSAPILLDAREPEEYAVSHIQGARNIGFEDFDLDTLDDIDKDAPIVIYCSVGYRSEKIGEKLQRAGFKNVVNLWGGIFDWANQQRPLVNGAEENVNIVHPYDENWGKWLVEEAELASD